MTTVASASVPMYAPFTSPCARKNGAMSGPTLPTSAERKLNTAPMATKARTPGRHTGARGTWRHSTTPSRNAPTSRSSARSGAVANSTPPSRASGTAPSANHPTTGTATSRRLNHTRLPLPMSWATVRIGIASRTPNTATSGASSSAAPPNPATAASVLARSAAPPSNSHCAALPLIIFPPGDGVRLEPPPPPPKWADDSYPNRTGRSLFYVSEPAQRQPTAPPRHPLGAARLRSRHARSIARAAARGAGPRPRARRDRRGPPGRRRDARRARPARRAGTEPQTARRGRRGGMGRAHRGPARPPAGRIRPRASRACRPARSASRGRPRPARGPRSRGPRAAGARRVIAYIALGGIFGTVARYLVQGVIQTRSGAFPSGTLAINIAGSLLLGFIVRFATGSTVLSPELRSGLTIGFCGAFTTMSTFSYETVALLQDGQYWRAGLYAGGTVLGCLLATVAGLTLAN